MTIEQKNDDSALALKENDDRKMTIAQTALRTMLLTLPHSLVVVQLYGVLSNLLLPALREHSALHLHSILLPERCVQDFAIPAPWDRCYRNYFSKD